MMISVPAEKDRLRPASADPAATPENGLPRKQSDHVFDHARGWLKMFRCKRFAAFLEAVSGRFHASFQISRLPA
jgi:hypothetical protein